MKCRNCDDDLAPAEQPNFGYRWQHAKTGAIGCKWDTGWNGKLAEPAEPRTDPGPCYGPGCDHVSHRGG